jgi:hypothetical protein
LVPERRRSRRAPKARSAPSELGERGNLTRIAPPALLRRSDRTRFSCRSDDEVGGLQRRRPRRASVACGAIRPGSPLLDVRPADLQEETTKRRRADSVGSCGAGVSSDPTKTAATWRTSQRAERAIKHRAIRAERAWRARQSNPDRATRRAEEEGGDMGFVPERRRSRRAAQARSAPSELDERGNLT